MVAEYCVTREALEGSSHPELEPRCFLIYMYMGRKDLVEDSYRREIHMKGHTRRILEVSDEDS